MAGHTKRPWASLSTWVTSPVRHVLSDSADSRIIVSVQSLTSSAVTNIDINFHLHINWAVDFGRLAVCWGLCSWEAIANACELFM